MNKHSRAVLLLLSFAALAACSAPGAMMQPANVAASQRTSSEARPRRAAFPPTPSGVHLNLVFNYAVLDVSQESGVVDVVWGASKPAPPDVLNLSYTTFEREDRFRPPAFHSGAWWVRNHPTWIEYLCDRTGVAFSYGNPNIPLDIANPDALQYQRETAVDPALRAGFAGVAFDNVDLVNDDHRCGHYSASGKWVAQYSGKAVDAAYERDVLNWARGTFAYVHALSLSAVMAVNFSYQSAVPFATNLALGRHTDLLFAESGFTDYGSPPYRPSAPQWRSIVRFIGELQAGGTCYTQNDELPGYSKRLSQSDRLWAIANYLLTRDDCTYLWISGVTPKGGQQYGRMLLYPEYRLPIGAPLGDMVPIAGVWERRYGGGLAIVNPKLTPATVPLQANYVDENGTHYAGTVTLPARSGQVLLSP